MSPCAGRQLADERTLIGTSSSRLMGSDIAAMPRRPADRPGARSVPRPSPQREGLQNPVEISCPAFPPQSRPIRCRFVVCLIAALTPTPALPRMQLFKFAICNLSGSSIFLLFCLITVLIFGYLFAYQL